MATDGLSVSGQAEAGATVTIRDSSNTVLGSAVANGNGQFIVPLNTAQTNGQALIATATDVAKNESAAATVIAPDSTAPEMPKNVVISEDGTSISGTAEPGSAITIATPDGKPLGQRQSRWRRSFYPSPRPRTDQRRTGYRHRHRQRQQRQPANHSASARYHRPG
ncbi:large repetitive protein [Salmonella enterica subsp. enterica]|nr:large repetitive protein [Salmonella enterica subsp. enterica]